MVENNFSQEEYLKKINRRNHIIPQSVSVTKKREDETNEQIIKRQEKFLSLDSGKRKLLGSHITGEKIYEIGKRNGLDNLEKIASIARVVRGYYFGEINKDEIINIIARETGSTQEVSRRIKQELEAIVFEKEKEYQEEGVKIKKIPILEAIKLYPEIEQQRISSEPLVVRGVDGPAKPSIRNWIRDYYQKVGAGSHGVVERGNYLYHSENGKRINYIDRQKVAIILKSVGENEVVDINEKEKKVIFKKIPTHEKQRINTNNQIGINNNQNKRRNNLTTLGLGEENYEIKPRKNRAVEKDSFIKTQGNLVDLR